jgi:UDP-GlcNAc:undecaprenyl-phosphate GlcNAc-1-phosphate transferase
VPIKFILPFLYSLLISIVAIFFLTKAKLSSKRRLGGVVVIAVFVALVILDSNIVITKPITGILVGGLLILLFGLWDDWKNLNWKWQLLFQILIASIVISFGVRSHFVTNPLGGIILLTSPIIYFILYTLYIIIFMNSLNWLDGADGLAAGVTLASLGTIFVLSFKPEVNQPATAILAAIAGGAILGFLIFNFFPAKILAGTTGAWFFGFILASLSIFAGAKIATVIMAALIPIMDLVRVVAERYLYGLSIFQRDDRHLHYLLLKRGFSERQIFFFYFVFTIFIGILALHLNAMGKLAMIIIVAVIYSLFFHIWIKEKNYLPS